MDRIKSLVAAAAIVALLPALALAQKTSFDFDKTADFAKLKTFTLQGRHEDRRTRWLTTASSRPSRRSWCRRD